MLHRMDYVKWKTTSKAKVSVKNFIEIKVDSLLEFKCVIAMDEIPHSLSSTLTRQCCSRLDYGSQGSKKS